MVVILVFYEIISNTEVKHTHSIVMYYIIFQFSKGARSVNDSSGFNGVCESSAA